MKHLGAMQVKSLLPKLLVLMVSLIFGFVMLDLALRPFSQERYSYRPEELFLQPWARCQKIVRFRANVRYEGTAWGDLAALSGYKKLRESRNVHFVTDDTGFRNDPLNVKGPFDTIILGDSFAAGTGTDQDETFTERLRAMGAANPYNLAVAPSGPADQYITLKTEIDRIELTPQPRLIWLIFSGNDLDDSYLNIHDTHVSAPRWIDEAISRLRVIRKRSSLSWLLRKHPALKNSAFRMKPLPNYKPALFFEPYAESSNRTLKDVRSHPHYAAFRESILATVELAHRRKIEIYVVIVPSKEEVYRWILTKEKPWSSVPGPSVLYQDLMDLPRSPHVHLLDLKPFLIRESQPAFKKSGQLLWWSDDTHWNAQGHALVASFLAQAIGRNH